MRSPTKKYQQVEAGLNRPLAAFVLDLRASGAPWRKVAAAVHAASGVDVTSEAIRTWFVGRDPIESERAA